MTTSRYSRVVVMVKLNKDVKVRSRRSSARNNNGGNGGRNQRVKCGGILTGCFFAGIEAYRFIQDTGGNVTWDRREPVTEPATLAETQVEPALMERKYPTLHLGGHQVDVDRDYDPVRSRRARTFWKCLQRDKSRRKSRRYREQERLGMMQ